MVGAQRLPGAAGHPGSRRRRHLRGQEHAARRPAGSFRRAGDRVHPLRRAGAESGRGPGDLPPDDRHAGGTESQGGAGLLDVRRLLRLCDLRGRYRYLLGALAGTGVPELGAGQSAARRFAADRARRHRRRLGLPVRADRQGSIPGRPAQCPGLVRPLPADQGRWRRRSGQRRWLREGISGHRRPAPAGQLWRFAGAPVAGDSRIEPRRRRARRRACREGIHGARARLPQGLRRHRDAGPEERWRHAGPGARRRPCRDRPGRPARHHRTQRRGRGGLGDRHGPLWPERARRDRQRQGQDRGAATGLAGGDRGRSGL
ncbi:MAG: hypothetical protein AW10_00893 [Candidatus Accumulibacter appositus]|uniref:Uncharacterized protein n=1 Tax=Candidatus Accumulibacter appositus TaxID=1454003 RepID=A0A011NGU1_9PROT|nr:MAG: hypothetical protein AW10_00893 [Candidatus Accumulibacter appositus]